MLCMCCKQNPAKVHLTQIDAGKMHKVDLCDDCAKQKGITDSNGFSLADVFLGSMGVTQEPAQVGEEIKCVNCGFTQADFKKAGRLGCSQCYVTFAEGLEGLLKSMHKGTRHVGKTPLVFQSRDLNDRLKQLQKKLDKAVSNEDFETAANLRDEIKETKEQLSHAAPN